MSKILKRLYLGDVVKSFGTKQLRKLTTEEPTESIVGTYVWNNNITPYATITTENFDETILTEIEEQAIFVEYFQFEYVGEESGLTYTKDIYGFMPMLNIDGVDGFMIITTVFDDGTFSTDWLPLKYFNQSFNVTSILGDGVWFKANATKQ